MRCVATMILLAGYVASVAVPIDAVPRAVIQAQEQTPDAGQVPRPTVDPTETNASTWANLLWIGVGIVFLVVLVGAILMGVRATGNRPPIAPGRRTRE